MAQELADWLAASEGIIPSGNGVVAGSASLIRGPPTDPAWAHSEPTVNAAKLVANSTPYLGVFGQRHALGELSGNRRQALQSKYQAAQRRFNFPDGETHTWAYWRAPLQAMLPDLQRVLGDGQRPRRGPRPRERRPASPSL